MSTNVVQERTEALLDHAETGCLELSEIAALAELLELTDEECEEPPDRDQGARAPFDGTRARGIEEAAA